MKEQLKETRKGYRRGQMWFFLGRNIIGIPFKILYNFRGKRYNIREQPFLLVANHTDNMDPAYEIVSINKYVRFVVSDHLTRKASLRILLKVLAAPIIYHREKGSDALYEEIVRNLHAGINVGVFIEGSKSNNGETGYISKRNAEMIKDGNCGLITYRNIGGYMKCPRWADNKRKGRSFGHIVNIYSREELQKMSVDEIYDRLLQDMYFNAYDEQRKNPRKYIAENPAESAEIMLYVCPKCKAIGSLKSKGDKISCSCGFCANIDDYGFWHSDDMEFDDIVRWDKFQKSVLKELTDCKKGTDALIFSDEKQIVYTLDEKGNRVLQGENAVLRQFADRIELSYKEENVKLPIDKINSIKIAAKMNLLIVLDNVYYEIHSEIPRSAIKYVVATRYLLGKENK